MKKYYVTLILLNCCLFINSQIVNIPDANFKNALVNTNCVDLDLNGSYESDADTNNDGEIQVSEAEAVQKLQVRSQGIISVEGIHAFINLTRLDCAQNEIETLDLSVNTSLEFLECNSNNLTSLNVSNSEALYWLQCSSNYLETIDVSNNSNLETFQARSNELDAINLTGLSNLEYVNLSINNLTSIDVSTNLGLELLIFQYNNLTSLDISQNSELTWLRCNNNNIANLDISNNLLLEHLYYGNNYSSDSNYNTIPWIDVSNHVNLTRLGVTRLNLNEVDISQNINLIDFECGVNQITELDVTNNIALEQLWFSSNGIQEIDLSQNVNLKWLACSGNFIENINLTNQIALERLYCNDNQLTSLNLNNNPNINFLNCQDNPLEILYVKNGNIFDTNVNFDIEGNFLLQYICADEEEFDIIEDRLNEYNIPNCVVTSDCDLTLGDYEVSGVNKLDLNEDGCQPDDLMYPYLKFELQTNDENLGYLISNSSGLYEIALNEGESNITPILQNPDYFNIQPSSVQVDFPTNTNPYSQDFCITPNGTYNDIEIVIVPIGAAIPGFESNYRIMYTNKGNTIISGDIQLFFNDDVLEFIDASQTTANQETGILTWDYEDLQPFQSRSINVTMLLNTPTDNEFPLNSGDVLSFETVIDPISNDETPEDNTFVLDQAVVNSFDPNDKTCLQGSEITEDEIGAYVHYLIRFENIGTANAINIKVTDTIDETKYDVSTVTPLDSSHEFLTRITGNVVDFIFENIQLPFDDANNDGYVLFKIKTLPSLEIGDSFDNNAEIFFDFNAPIITEDAITTIVSEELSISEFENTSISMFPNPTKDILYFDTTTPIEALVIYDVNGRILKQMVPTGSNLRYSINVNSLAQGSYFISVKTETSAQSYKFIKE